MFDFNAFSPPISSSSTLIAFQASSAEPAGTQVRFAGTNLSYNSQTGTMSGTITHVIVWDANTNSPKQAMAVSSPAALLTRLNSFLQASATFANTLKTWFGNQTLTIDDNNVALNGTSLVIPILDASHALLGYIKAFGTNLTDSNLDKLGVITSVIHEDTSHVAVSGHVMTSGVTPAIIQYGMLKVSDGAIGNEELVDGPIAGGSDTFIASGKPGSLDGGAGNDTYVLGTFDNIIKDAAGTDTIASDVSRDLASPHYSGVEDLMLGTGALYGYGNAAHNTITGNSAANTLKGRDGNDVLKGQAGNDILSGDAGNDTLVGGAGRDILTGGKGQDRFDFTSLSDMGKTAAARDVIKDFVHGTDKIGLAAIDANGSAAGNAAFSFLDGKGAAFTGHRGDLHYFQIDVANTALDKTIVEGDLDGDKKADFQIELTGLKLLTATDFIL